MRFPLSSTCRKRSQKEENNCNKAVKDEPEFDIKEKPTTVCTYKAEGNFGGS